jgi:hypothetical protein
MISNSPTKFTAADVLIYLRGRFMDAREKDDKDSLRDIAVVFNILWDLTEEKKIHGEIVGILENFVNSSYDSIQGVGWKSIIPTEEEIQKALEDA